MKSIRKLTLPKDLSHLEDFANWIAEQFPYIQVEITEANVCLVDGKPHDFCGDTRLHDLEMLFLECSPLELFGEYQASHDINVTYDKKTALWRATSRSNMGAGFGQTPYEATQMLLHTISGRRLFWFNRQAPDFSGLHVNSALSRKLCERGVYSTQNIKHLTVSQVHWLDYRLNAKNRIIELYYEAHNLEQSQ